MGGLTFCGSSLAGTSKGTHNPHLSRKAVPAPLPSDAPPVSALSDSTRQQISQLVAIAPHRSRQERIVLISQTIKGTPYLAQPLIGSATTQEELILSWRGVNCMTFVEIILAASMSLTVAQFIHALISVRYRHHHVAFMERRHFLSDWLHGSPVLCRDLGSSFPYAQHAEKILNLKLPTGSSNSSSSPERQQSSSSIGNAALDSSTERYLPGLPLKKRSITYLPTRPFLNDLQNGGVRGRIKNGDVIGIYSPLSGLDVFHIGLAIWRHGELLFRNASSLPEHRYVVDTPLGGYLKERRGVVVYRPIF